MQNIRQNRKILEHKQYKIENNESKKSVLITVRVIISMTIKFGDFDSDNILLNEKSYENILVYGISYKPLIGDKPRIRLDKIDGFIRVYDETKYLVLLGLEKYDAIYNKIRYLIGLKRGITYVFFHNCAEIKVDSYDSLPLEKTLTLLNVIIHIKSVFNKD